jgi:hypoxanthine phosphoribosyltransferase
MRKKVITWGDIDKLISDLALDIKIADYQIDNIYGVSRDGLIPAVLLSHKLSIPLSDSVNENTLVVDDIVNKNNLLEKTLNDSNYYLRHNDDIYTASLIKRERSSFEPTFVGLSVEYNDWIIFPWDYEIHQIENMETSGI